MFIAKNSKEMSKLNQIRVEDILIGMGVTVNGTKHRQERRFNDCYATVAKFINFHKNKDAIDDCSIFFYAIGDETAHCVLKNKDNNIVADDFADSRKYYNPNTNEVVYSNIKLGSDHMGKSYNSGPNSFTMKVSDFKKLFCSDQMIDILVERKQNRKRNGDDNSVDNKRDIVKAILEEIPINSIINGLQKESLLNDLKENTSKV